MSIFLRFLAFNSGQTCLMNRIVAYSNNAAWIKIMHEIIQPEIDVRDSVLGDLAMTPIIIFMIVSVKMISNAILPGIASDGITKLICKVKGFVIFLYLNTYWQTYPWYHNQKTRRNVIVCYVFVYISAENNFKSSNPPISVNIILPLFGLCQISYFWFIIQKAHLIFCIKC